MTDKITAQPSRLFWLRLAGSVAALVLVLYLLGKHWAEILKIVRQLPAGLLGLMFLLMIISRLAVAGRWHILLRAAGVKISPGQSARINFAGLFANNFLPTTIGGDVARLAGAILLGFDRSVCLASLIVDRLVGMAGMAMILPFGLPVVLRGMIRGSSPLPVAMPVIAGAAAVEGSRWRSIWEKGVEELRRVLRALGLWWGKPADLAAALAFSWVHMICFIAILSLLLKETGQSVPIWLVAGLWSINYFVTQLPVSINGWGVQELAIVFLFTHYGGVSPEVSLVLALLLRILQMIASLPGALFIGGIVARERPQEQV